MLLTGLSQKILGKTDLAMIQYLFQKEQNNFGQMTKLKKMRMDHRFVAFKKKKKKLKFL